MKTILFVLLSLYAITGIASEVGYEVEVIVFKNNNPIYQNAENWHLVEKPAEGETTETNSDSQKQSDTTDKNRAPVFTMLNPDKYQLTSLAKHIESNPDYTLLYHTAWSQPGLDEEHAVDFKVAIPYPDSNSTNTSADASTPAIDASFKLVMSRYLHFSVDMLIPFSMNPVNSQEQQTPKPTYVEFTDTRRMRSREIHYIDHPLVGVIIQAIPFKIETDKDTSAKPGSYQTL